MKSTPAYPRVPGERTPALAPYTPAPLPGYPLLPRTVALATRTAGRAYRHHAD